MKVARIRADELQAGDRIVVTEGRIRKTYPVVEVQWREIGNLVSYVYKGRGGEFIHINNVSGKRRMTVRDD